MSSFEDRKKVLKKNLLMMKNCNLKLSARRNKYIAEWVSNSWMRKKKRIYSRCN